MSSSQFRILIFFGRHTFPSSCHSSRRLFQFFWLCTFMADAFEFELEVDAATEAEAALVAALRSQLSSADDELAQAFVNKMYGLFFDALPSAAKKSCKDTEMRELWLKDWYWKALEDFVNVVKVAYIPHIDMATVSAEERQRTDNLHSKLSKQDHQAVLQLFTVEYNKYFNGLDSSVREACDEQMSQRIQRSWISNNYVATMEQYVATEKDKFEFDKYLQAMAPELQEAATTLLPCLRNSEADKVVQFLNEEWENYVEKSCDAMMFAILQVVRFAASLEDATLCAMFAELCSQEGPPCPGSGFEAFATIQAWILFLIGPLEESPVTCIVGVWLSS